MKKFILDDSLFELFPDAKIEYFTVFNIDNHLMQDNYSYFLDLLKKAKKEAQQYIQIDPFRDNEVVSSWRNVYQKFKKKKGARSSIEALLKRVSQDRDFEPIIPLVDLYNSISLRYGIPCGGENIDAISDNMHLGVTEGGDKFLPLGSDKDEPTLNGEVCYYDDEGAICRCWNWREAQRTMLTEDTKNAVLVTEAATREQAKSLHEAMKELQALVNNVFDVVPNELITLDKNNKEGIIVK